MELRSEEEFVQMVERYKGVIYKVCNIYADDRDQMEDYCQEVLINMWRGWQNFRGECALSTWVYRVALYTCVSFVRRKGSRPHNIPLKVDMAVEAEAERGPMLRELYRLIGRLNRLDRALILLCRDSRYHGYVEGQRGHQDHAHQGPPETDERGVGTREPIGRGKYGNRVMA